MNPIQFHTEDCATFSDLDPNGHMSAERYLFYFLKHRFTGMREQMGLNLKKFAELPFTFFMREAKISYRRPLYGDQKFKITSRVKEFGASSCLVQCEMISKDKEIAICEFQLVCIDKTKNSVCAWPEEFKALFYGSDK